MNEFQLSDMEAPEVWARRKVEAVRNGEVTE
jgi:hypothetical protein